MLSGAVKKRLAQLERDSASAVKDSPFLPKSEWPDGYATSVAVFVQRAHASPDPYIYLLEHLDELPPEPLKPLYNAIRGNAADQEQLWLAVKNMKRI